MMCNGVFSDCGNFSKTISLSAGLLTVKLFCSASPSCFKSGGSSDGVMTLLATLLCGVVMALFILIDDVRYWGHCSCNSAMTPLSQMVAVVDVVLSSEVPNAISLYGIVQWSFL